MSGRCFEGHEIAARALEIQIQCLDVEVLEFSQRGVGAEFHLQSTDRFSGDSQSEVIDDGLQGGLDILAIPSCANCELSRDRGRREIGASQRLPVGGIQPVDGEFEGGLRKPLARLGPRKCHGLIESTADDGTPRLGDGQFQFLDSGRLLRLVHGRLVLGDDLEFWSLVAGRGR